MFARNLFYSGTGIKISHREREREMPTIKLFHDIMIWNFYTLTRHVVSCKGNETRPTRKCMGTASQAYIYIYIVNSMNKALPRIREQVFMITFHDLSAHTTKWRWKGVSQKQTDI